MWSCRSAYQTERRDAEKRKYKMVKAILRKTGNAKEDNSDTPIIQEVSDGGDLKKKL